MNRIEVTHDYARGSGKFHSGMDQPGQPPCWISAVGDGELLRYLGPSSAGGTGSIAWKSIQRKSNACIENGVNVIEQKPGYWPEQLRDH